MDKQTIKYLYHAYLSGSLDSDELSNFMELVKKGDDPILNELIDADWNRLGGLSAPVELRDKVMTAVAKTSQADVQKPHRRWSIKVAVAAAVAVVVFGVGLFIYKENRSEQTPQSAFENDIAPGKVGATLTLATGKKIRLSQVANGELAKEAGITITKSATGLLVYEVKQSNRVGAALGAVNTLSTANGETYQVRLPDGSKVWLNAESSITYSANLLDQGKRSVRLIGEGYFEIAKDKDHPFIVESNGQKVQVLGTHFNIEAYKDKNETKTTLVEGAVDVNSVKLKPSQQAVLHNGKIDVAIVDTDAAISWKEGYFLFENETLADILLDASHWYDVSVVFQNSSLRALNFSGSVNRFSNISELLRMLELTGKVSFRVSGKTVYVDQLKSK